MIYCTRGWRNRHGRFYSPKTLGDRILEPGADAFRFRIHRLLHTEVIDPSIYASFALLAERT